METPRTQPKVQPEIQFAGSIDVPASRQSNDPAVTAAFVAFHRSTGGAAPLPARTRCFSRGALGLTALAVLGFGGGLFLAFFSFNSPEASGSVVGARPPELIYTARTVADAPAEPAPAPEYAISDSADAIAAPVFALSRSAQSGPETSIWPEPNAESNHSFASSYGSGGGQAFAAITAPSAPGEGPGGLAPSDITTGFDALTAAPVPEPSTWATMISGAGLLLLVNRLKRRRR